MSTSSPSGVYPDPATTPGKQHILHEDRPVCILGLGLIGGSIMRDLQARGRRVFGWDRTQSTVTNIIDDGFDASNECAAVLERAEYEDALVVIATPMSAVGTMLDHIAQHAPSCGITDVVSVKQAVIQEVHARGMHDRFVGGHPMSGTSHNGWDASQEGLFTGAPWVVTFDNAPADDSDDGRWMREWMSVVNLAYDVGAEVVPARAQSHDKAVARISHLPHVLADALAVAGDNGGALALSLAAGSFRDGTRVAGSDPGLTEAMCGNNVEEVVRAIREVQMMLDEARKSLRATPPTVAELADAGHRSRIRYEARTGKRPVLRLHPGDDGWVDQLKQAENLGARIEVF